MSEEAKCTVNAINTKDISDLPIMRDSPIVCFKCKTVIADTYESRLWIAVKTKKGALCFDCANQIAEEVNNVI